MIPSTMVPLSLEEISQMVKTILFGKKGNIAEFESTFSEYMGSEYAIVTQSGTSALYVLAKAHGLNKGDEVLMPAYTCETIGRLFLDMGYSVKFVDVDKETYNLSTEDLNSKISKNTKAVLAIHMFGIPCEIDEICEIATDFGSLVVEDAAQAMGAEFKGKKVGTIANSSFFSMGRGKPITAMNGGIIITDDKKIADNVSTVMQKFNPIHKSAQFMLFTKFIGYFLLKNPVLYNLIYKNMVTLRDKRRENIKVCCQTNNYNFKFTEMQAAVSLVQFSKLDNFNAIRKENAEYLIRNLSKFDVCTPKIPKHSEPTFLRLPIWFENITSLQRDELITMLQRKGIDAPVAYPNVLPHFYGMHHEKYPNTEELVSKTIVLPTHPMCNISSNRIIIDVIEEFI